MIIMKWKIVFLILICLLFTGCVLGQKEEFNDYLEECTGASIQKMCKNIIENTEFNKNK